MQQIAQAPDGKEMYFAALFGAVVGYIALVFLVALSAVIGTSDLEAPVNALVTGLLLLLVPAVVFAALVIAPIGAIIALAVRRWAGSSHWLGAITGVLTAVTLALASHVLLDADWRGGPDVGTYLFLAGGLAIAAVSGWYAQRTVLRWPVRA
ncbi:MAG: hypothetical protein QNI87_06810 [Erythrobacter sp.]|uniref:hypothetical protein n=1 Tax=Erythrobacter sp. TaxID=1042 RepID=UPI0026338699|nr:hypothetical protein [Erythrobacter sp.]MDJ0978228.1 hypothetical protein [Erythrobacter sp.]